jgi:hypothetical protein
VSQDGFGTRTLSIDQESGDHVEVLTFTPTLARAPEFAASIGERVARLARVRHAMYARVRRIDRPSEGALRLYSDHVPAWRLGHVLDVIERERWALDISAVITLLRQLIPAVALFSRHQRDATIGTIGPERLLLTPQSRLVLAEYVLAPGLEKLHFPRERLWREFRVAVPFEGSVARIPPSADVVGIGVVAMSLLLGRRLKDDEYLVWLGDLCDTLTETSGRTTKPLSAAFRAWVASALQFDPERSFQSTQEAQVAFEEMLAREHSYVTSTAQLDRFITAFERVAGAPRTPSAAHEPDRTVQADEAALTATLAAISQASPAPPRVATEIDAIVPGDAHLTGYLVEDAPRPAIAPEGVAAVLSGAPTFAPDGATARRPSAPDGATAGRPIAPDSATAGRPSAPDGATLSQPSAPSAPAFAPDGATVGRPNAPDGATLSQPSAPSAPAFAATVSRPSAPGAPSAPSAPGSWRRFAMPGLAAVVLIQAGVIAWLVTTGGAATLTNGEIAIQSRPLAARVTIDGEERGITPFESEISPGSHVVEVRVGKSEPRVIPVMIRSGVQTGLYVELQSVATMGGLEVRTEPARARVSIGGQFRGETPLVLKELPPGDVDVLIQGQHREVRQTVRIEPGITSQLVVPLGR